MYTKVSVEVGSFFRFTLIPLILILMYSGGVYYAYSVLGIERIDIPLAISTVLGFAVSLSLGFRTNSAYDRWWEARKIWGAIINDSRSLIRQLIGFIEEHEQEKDIEMVTRHVIAWCYSLRNALRNIDPILNLDKYLDSYELEEIQKHDNIPNAILKIIEMDLKGLRAKGAISEFEFVSLDQTVKSLCDHMGKCERIKKTIFPIQYRVFTQFGIVVFILMLPYGMLKSTGPFVMLISTVVLFFFLYLEKLAHDLQDPFSNKRTDIPMTAICRTIEINLLQLIEASNIPDTIKPDRRGVLM